jgi:hypothetical protein
VSDVALRVGYGHMYSQGSMSVETWRRLNRETQSPLPTGRFRTREPAWPPALSGRSEDLNVMRFKQQLYGISSVQLADSSGSRAPVRRHRQRSLMVSALALSGAAPLGLLLNGRFVMNTCRTYPAVLTDRLFGLPPLVFHRRVSLTSP